MIYDCFSYWDEDLLLDLRLNILNNYVDYFVIVEGNKTWQNNSKKLRFDINKFQKFKKKNYICSSRRNARWSRSIFARKLSKKFNNERIISIK